MEKKTATAPTISLTDNKADQQSIKPMLTFAKIVSSGDVPLLNEGSIVYAAPKPVIQPSKGNTSDIDSNGSGDGLDKVKKGSKKRNSGGKRNGNTNGLVSNNNGARRKEGAPPRSNGDFADHINLKLDIQNEKSAAATAKGVHFVLSPAPIPKQNAWFSGNTANLRDRLVSPTKVETLEPKVNESAPEVEKVVAVSKVPESKAWPVLETETESVAEKSPSDCKEEPSVAEVPSVWKVNNNTVVPEGIENNNQQSKSPEPVDNGFVAKDKNRKKVLSKTVKKHHEQVPIRNGGDSPEHHYSQQHSNAEMENVKDGGDPYCYYDTNSNGFYYIQSGHQGWKKNHKNSRPSSEKSNSPGNSCLSDYIVIDGEPLAEEVSLPAPMENSYQPQMNKNGYAKRGHNFRRYNNRNGGSDNEFAQQNYTPKYQQHRERGPLPSWDESAAVNNEGEAQPDYMTLMDNQFQMMNTFGNMQYDATQLANGSPSVIPNGGHTMMMAPQHYPMMIPPEFGGYSMIPTFLPPTNPHMINYYNYINSGGMMMAPAAPAMPEENILRQVEYYFSVENLSGDYFIRRKMRPDGYLSMELLASFPRIKSMTQDIDFLTETLKQSQVVEISEDGKFIRPRETPDQWYLGENSEPKVMKEHASPTSQGEPNAVSA
uniref:HTH La-type RNA-binding domain-containing protein n=1 Tax=Rhabditophanes sp. KR3021 TaxID=114890 RepID=A0AC35TPC4_9BILA